MANSTSRSRRAEVCLCLGFGKRGRRWISLHDRLARHESAMTANTLCSDTSHIPDWPCRFLYTWAFSGSNCNVLPRDSGFWQADIDVIGMLAWHDSYFRWSRAPRILEYALAVNQSAKPVVFMLWRNPSTQHKRIAILVLALATHGLAQLPNRPIRKFDRRPLK
jgi:hypothetical protein